VPRQAENARALETEPQAYRSPCEVQFSPSVKARAPQKGLITDGEYEERRRLIIDEGVGLSP
jgi:hypothetical protein